MTTVTSTTTTGTRESFQQRVYFFLTELRTWFAEAPLDVRTSLTDESLTELAHVLADGTVFHVVADLIEGQRLEEHALHKQLADLRSEQSAERIELRKRHCAERQAVQASQHQLPVLQKEQEQEIQHLRKRQQDAMRGLITHIIHVLDGRVVEQQAGLERIGCYLFTPTTNPQQIRLQMHVLDWIMRLARTAGPPSVLPPPQTSSIHGSV